MQEKPTGDLREELMQAPSIDTYIHDNQEIFAGQEITESLAELYDRKAISKAALARKSGMSEVYLHQVFSGRRMPSRDRLLCICIALELSLEETQDLLKRASYAQLYPRIQRDAIISYGILHHMDLEEINQTLFAENEKTLS